MEVIPKEMLDLIRKQESELAFLEELFEEECKCTSTHEKAVSSKCSVKAEWRVIPHCGQTEVRLWCMNAYKAFMKSKDSKDKTFVCAGCHKRLIFCWTVLPI